MTQSEIRELEKLSLSAWPADTELRLDGWALRFTRGYTRRANSVHPLHESTRPTAQKIRECEQLYWMQSSKPPATAATAARTSSPLRWMQFRK
jgi:hypothetical protein